MNSVKLVWGSGSGTVRYGTVRYGTVQYGTVRYGTSFKTSLETGSPFDLLSAEDKERSVIFFNA